MKNPYEPDGTFGEEPVFLNRACPCECPGNIHLPRFKFYRLWPCVALLILDWLGWHIFGLYQEFPWLDMPMHLLGGASIAYLCTNLTPFSRLGAVALSAIAWEAYEWVMVNCEVWSGVVLTNTDTVSDLLLGVVGGAVWIVCSDHTTICPRGTKK